MSSSRMGTAFATLLAMVMTAQLLQAQQTPKAAPVPVQISAAKRLFIANVPGEAFNFSNGIQPTRAYDEFYATLNTWGKFDLVSAPADADLILEVAYKGGQTKDYLQVMVVDPKTKVPLWWVAEPVQWAAKKANALKNFDQAMSKLTADVQGLFASSSTNS